VHVVVMGCGRVGSALALALDRLDHVVVVIDYDPAAFRRLGEEFGGSTVAGVGFDRDTLVEAGIERADAFAAVSSGDNSNIISARVARETFGVDHVVARIYDPRRAEVYERLGIPTVATVPWTSGRLLKKVLGASVLEEWRDPTGGVVLLALTPDPGWVGRKVSAFEAATGGRVGVVTRFGVGKLPKETPVLQAGDTVHLFTTEDAMAEVKSVASQPPED
jgi:trk system potassium uptake protein TrkA